MRKSAKAVAKRIKRANTGEIDLSILEQATPEGRLMYERALANTALYITISDGKDSKRNDSASEA